MAAFCRHFISQSIRPFGGQKHRCLLRAGKRGIMEKEQLVSRKKILSVAFAYVGILTGAGLASGRELVQYFISFGRAGMAGIVIIAVLYMLFGKMILSLGSYYRAQNHSDVLEQVSHPIVSQILDGSMIFSCFILSFVMIVGAGSSLGQQFSIPSWIGSLICAGMILAVSYMEFDQVIGALGIFTPMILLIILAAFFTVLTGDPVPWKEMLETGQEIESSLPNVYVSVVNYFALCMMTSTSMLFVLGGSIMGLKNAKKGGILGGFFTGMITVLIALLLVSRIDLVADANVPMQKLLGLIHPTLGFLMTFVIFGMIFNTGFSACYSLAKRLSGDKESRFRKLMPLIVLTAFALSFFGFKKLVAFMYPVLGYLGILLLAVLLIAWIKERGNIKKEGKVRRGIFRLMMYKADKNKVFTEQDKRHLDILIHESAVDDKEIRKDMEEIVEERQEEIKR